MFLNCKTNPEIYVCQGEDGNAGNPGLPGEKQPSVQNKFSFHDHYLNYI